MKTNLLKYGVHFDWIDLLGEVMFIWRSQVPEQKVAKYNEEMSQIHSDVIKECDIAMLRWNSRPNLVGVIRLELPAIHRYNIMVWHLQGLPSRSTENVYR